MNLSVLRILVLAVAMPACMQTVRESKIVSEGQQPVVVAPEAGKSALDAELEYANGVVRGRLRWATVCHNALEERSHEDIVEVSKPNHGAAVAAMLVGGLITAVSSAVLSNLDAWSEEETCGTNLNGDYSCSSPRMDATVGGVMGIVGGVALAGGGLATFGAKTKSETVDTVPQPPRLLRVERAAIPCGNGPIPEVNVAMYLGQQRLSASSSNVEGQFALVVPENTTGKMTVVLESAPQGSDLIRSNVRLGTIEISAEKAASARDEAAL